MDYNFAYLIKMKDINREDDNLGNLVDTLPVSTSLRIFSFFVNPAFTLLFTISFPNFPRPIILAYLILMIFLINRISIQVYDKGIRINNLISEKIFPFHKIEKLEPIFKELVKGGGCKMIYDIKTGELSHIDYLIKEKNSKTYTINFNRYRPDSLERFLKALKLDKNPYINEYKVIYSPFDLVDN